MTASSSLRLCVGIDGGGSGTRARLVAADGRRLGHGEAGPSALGQGMEQAWRHVLAATAAALECAGLDAAALGDPAWRAGCGLGLGLSGAENPAWARAFHDSAPSWGRIALESDGWTALLGAHAGAPGALVVAGSGSVGVARCHDGRRLMVGGWGWRLGDEGSGAWLGQQAVRHAQQALDGRAPAAALARAIWARCGAERHRLLAWSLAADQAAWAALAPMVFDLEAADAAAAALIAAAAAAVETLALTLDPAGALPLVITGSVGARLLPRLDAALRQRIVQPAGDAMDGALGLLSAAAPAGIIPTP
ncbi:N-acetylglucosamine kinase of eukaryotic type [Rubrivivax sp. A210]|uniref:BadF/BadG/BcrA/BcrD ATPase family protein n=1 Tax=Rubrivivax sp. A210 TaxID=2772301 RepID=UPI001919E467|nr:BadF/BadG/BcrA/BcrD ATPase family protein [Rubrivivax sp. A210]CAD5375163.1 N-acetylglucosamine kinase of eukaryotic type [Rubrivivax sp. A210]